jgi:plastocyanin
MPPWAQTQGGPLSDEQIRQLMVLITKGRWDLVHEENQREDVFSTKVNIKGEAVDWAKLAAPMSDDTISLRATDVSVFNLNDYIRLGEERMKITGVPSPPSRNGRPGNWSDVPASQRNGIIQVERGVLGSTPFEHAEGDTIYRYAGPVMEPTILQTSCGQTARPAAPSRPPALVEPFEGQTVNVVAQGVAFNVREITVRTGGRVRVRLENKDSAVDHNIAFYRSSTDLTPVAAGSVGIMFGATLQGEGVDDTVFDIPAAGNYFFRCDVHPTTMTGTFRVQ